MRRTLLAASTLTVAALTLAACGGGGDGAGGSGDDESAASDGHIVIGASPTPHAEILEFVQDNLAADAGLDLEIVTYDDYVLPNTALSEGDLDANYFQHLPYFEEQVESQGFDFDHFEGIHIEPFALYSDTLTDVADLPEGGQIGITNDPSNQARALDLLVQAGIITLTADAPESAGLTDIDENELGLEFIEADPASLVRTLQDVDAAIINGNFALEGGLNPATDSLLIEDGEGNPYANFVAVRSEDIDDPDLVALDGLLHSDEVRAFIEETWPAGEIIPAF
ncbi:MetQ/NlpA family ABC transporter substrate-binding protein [Occultella kanbiaonis]|uniref:MetQ/NlpA family ABC transporter substrate-binding protein n=1 Tax=Occultella kanbiaonis TaxID=2675754 RepID=UPI0012B729BD|nr:MetQ/NlpA family ABC transporter substrate-binding protein [Occultella kanbiaonis]